MPKPSLKTLKSSPKLLSLAKTFKSAADNYELKRLGLLDSTFASPSDMMLGRLISPAWALLRAARSVQNGNTARRHALQFLALSREHPVGPDDWAISCPYQLGDVYLYSTLAKALLTHHGGHRVIFFTKPQHAFIPRLFPSVSEAVAVESPFVPAKIGLHNTDSFQRDANKGRYFKPNWGAVDMLGYRDLTLIDCFRGNLRLPANAELEKPRAPDSRELDSACELLYRRGKTPGRVAIVCPDATGSAGLPPIPDEFWEAVIARLQELNIQCVTNVGGPAQRVLQGAPALQISLESFRAVASAAGFVIANRSGIADLVSDLPINLAVLYPAGDYFGSSMLPATNLRAMNWGHDPIELEVGADWRAALALLMDALENAISHSAQE